MQPVYWTSNFYEVQFLYEGHKQNFDFWESNFENFENRLLPEERGVG